MTGTTVPPDQSDVIEAYQALLEIEYTSYTNDDNIIRGTNEYLSYQDIIESCPTGITPETIISGEEAPDGQENHDLIVKVSDSQDRDLSEMNFQTTHFDLIRRIAELRNLYAGQRMVMEPFLTKTTEAIPDFGEFPVDSTFSNLEEVSDEVTEILQSVLELEENFSGFSTHQAKVIKSILGSEGLRHSISAPTAAGKSLTFMTPALTNAIEHGLNNDSGTRSLLVYPRNALARDQLESLIFRIYHINKKLKEKGASTISIGIDTGDTPKTYDEIKDGDQFFGQTCPCCNAKLVYDESSMATIHCSQCDERLTFIKGTKNQISTEKPEIVLTNIHTIYNRLLRPDTVSRFKTVEYVVLDEAHVYTNYLGGHLRYILQILDQTARTNSPAPKMVFSSATISNPVVFISDLSGVPKSELSHIKYSDVYKKEESATRVLLRLYVAPPPNRSVEALNQGLAQIVTLWCHRNGYRAINFIDSIAEINKQRSFLKHTILSPYENNGDEIVRHVYDGSTDKLRKPSDPFSWSTLAPKEELLGQDTFRNWVTNQLSDSIHNHYAGLTQEERNKTIRRFRDEDGGYSFLMATSTLEYGIDLKEIAAVLQYKLPPGSEEGVIQRIGRAGRSTSTNNVGLGIVALSSKPTSMLYLYDKDLRKKLEDTENLPPSKVGSTSSVHQQHIISTLLNSRAREGKETYHAGSGSLKTVDHVFEFVNELVGELEALDEDSVPGLDREIFEEERDRILQYLSHLPDKYEEPDSNLKFDPGEFIVELDGIQSKINKVREEFSRAYNKLTKAGVPESKLSPLKDTVEALESIQRHIRSLRDALRETWEEYSQDPIEYWYKKNLSELRDAIDQVPGRSLLRSMLYTDLIPWINQEAGGLERFEKEKNVDIDSFTSVITDTGAELDVNSDSSLHNQLKEVISNADLIRGVDLAELGRHQSVKRLEKRFDETYYNSLSVFDALNAVMQNAIKFSSLLNAPEPEFMLEVDSQ